MFPSQDVVVLCERLSLLVEQLKQLDRELRTLVNIKELSLEQCQELFDIVPLCYTSFKIVERMEELENNKAS